MKTTKLVMAALGVLAICTTTYAANVTGNWKSQTKTPRGTVEQSFVFRQEGGKLAGHIISPHGRKEEIKDGKVVENKIEFSVERQQPGGGTGIASYKGQVQGDEIKGAFLGPGGHTIEWTATRQKRRGR